MWKLAVINVSILIFTMTVDIPFLWSCTRSGLRKGPFYHPAVDRQQTLQGIVDTAQDKPGPVCAACAFQFLFGMFSKSATALEQREWQVFVFLNPHI